VENKTVNGGSRKITAATLAASIRRGSSKPALRLLFKVHVGKGLPLASFATKQLSNSWTDQGGGNARHDDGCFTTEDFARREYRLGSVDIPFG
jgi:hypothetical protein